MNKLFDHPGKIVSWLTLFGILSFAAYTVIDTSKDVEANTKNIYNVQAWINEKRIENKLLKKINERDNLPQRKEPYCEWENDVEWCWDEKYKEWWRAL